MKFSDQEVNAISAAINTYIDGYAKWFGEKDARENLKLFYQVKEKIQKKARKRMLKAVIDIEIENERLRQQVDQLAASGGAA